MLPIAKCKILIIFSVLCLHIELEYAALRKFSLSSAQELLVNNRALVLYTPKIIGMIT